MRTRLALVAPIPLFLLLVGPAAAQEPEATEADSMIARYAVLLGGRKPGTAPATGSVMGGDDVLDRLLDWDPAVDGDEVRRVLALDELGELGRQAAALPLSGGAVSGSYDHEGSRYHVAIAVRPGGRAEDGRELVTISGRIDRDGAPLSAPSIRAVLGERALVASEAAPGDFLFLVVEADRISAEELRRRGLRHAWSDEYALVDGTEVQAPRIVDKAPPAYPQEAREKGHQGRVLLRAAIDAEGRVEEVEIVEGQPYGLSEAAAEAVRSWRFEPATRNGEPVKVLYLLTVNFRLG